MNFTEICPPIGLKPKGHFSPRLLVGALLELVTHFLKPVRTPVFMTKGWATDLEKSIQRLLGLAQLVAIISSLLHTPID